MRVFHGLINIGNMPSVMARAEREIGLQSVSACLPAGYLGYAPDIVESSTSEIDALLRRFERYADSYDVFVFYFGNSFAYDTLADIPLLKKMGKSVIFYFCGCDIRQSKETIQKYKFSACGECWPQDCSRNRDLARATAQKYADKIWVSSPDLLEFVPGAELFPQPVDLSPFEGHEAPPANGTDRPFRVVHAPTHTGRKGTRYVTAAIDQLQKEGLPVELLLLEKMPHAEVLEKMRQGNLAVDQLLQGIYGVLSIELMALGIPTICYLRDDLIPQYPEKPPLQNADPETIASVIRDMVKDPARYKNLSEQGLLYAKKYHDAKVAARRSAETYRAIRNAA